MFIDNFRHLIQGSFEHPEIGVIKSGIFKNIAFSLGKYKWLINHNPSYDKFTYTLTPNFVINLDGEAGEEVSLCSVDGKDWNLQSDGIKGLWLYCHGYTDHPIIFKFQGKTLLCFLKD